MARRRDSDQLHLNSTRAVFHRRMANFIHHDVNRAALFLRAQARQQPRRIATGNCSQILRSQRMPQIFDLIERAIWVITAESDL